MTPDAINDLLATQTDYEITSGTEQAEGELRAALTGLANAVGNDAFRLAMCRIFAEKEAYLRGLGNPNHPALLALDEARADGIL